MAKEPYGNEKENRISENRTTHNKNENEYRKKEFALNAANM